MVLVFRVLQPVARSLRHQLKVVSVIEEAPGVVSVVCSGRQISWLAVSGGQFFQWRFLTRELWWHAHPYSLSALPRAPFVRVTVKGLGDQSRALAHLKPGTRVFIEGPYGAFTRHARRSDRVVLIGAGVGITPLRALLEDLPPNVDAVVVVRATTADEIVHRDEIVELVRKRKGEYHEVLGDRSQVRMGGLHPAPARTRYRTRDVYVCGPEGFNELVVSACREARRVREQHSRGEVLILMQREWHTRPVGPAGDTERPVPLRRTPSMRRSVIVIAATVAGLVGLLSFHTTPARLGLAGLSGRRQPGLPLHSTAAGHPALGRPTDHDDRHDAVPGGGAEHHGGSRRRPRRPTSRTATGVAVELQLGRPVGLGHGHGSDDHQGGHRLAGRRRESPLPVHRPAVHPDARAAGHAGPECQHPGRVGCELHQCRLPAVVAVGTGRS